MEKMRVQKFIARSGFCSRRKAEEFIKQGKVFINEKPVKLGDSAQDGDSIIICGRKIRLVEKKIYVILNKPVGYTCTNRKFSGEKNIFDLVNIKERLFIAGRLDKDSRGLVLLTNDGDLAQRLTHPKFECCKKYIVELRIKNKATLTGGHPIRVKLRIKDIENNFLKGVDINDNENMCVIAKVKDVKYLGDNRFEIMLTEGKKRQIRKMFKKFGCEVKDLSRTEIGELKLGNLKQGEYRYLTDNEIKILKSDSQH